MKGKLYGIGTGPGDPELLTLKAIRIIEECDVIAFPNAGNDERTAFQIVEKYLAGKPLLECRFSMEKDKEKRKVLRAKAADDVCEVLEQGKDVGFITLGDPTVYSTYMYVHRLVGERGFDTRIISGIPSFIAAAAALNTSLCEGNELLHIIPASENELPVLPGNAVIMKPGGNLRGALPVFGPEAEIKIVERCTMAGERIWEPEELEADPGYFSIAVVKRKERR